MDARATVRAIYRTFSEREVTFLAAAFAYYAFVSLIPLVLLALVVGSLVGGEATAERLVVLAGDFLPPAGEDLLTAALTTESGRTEATLVALAVSAWGAVKVFRGLSLAFDRVYGDESDGSIGREVVEGLAVVVGIAVALALMVAVGVALAALADRVPFASALGRLVMFLGLTAALLPIYYLLPPIDVSARETLPGTVVAAVGWSLLQVGFQVYAANAGQYEAYGVMGAILLFVSWLYFAGILILFGAVVNVVLFGPGDAVEGEELLGGGESAS